jgi:hypothetical protein
VFTQLSSGGNHPTSESEHGASKGTRTIEAGFQREPFEMDLLHLLYDPPTVTFSQSLVWPTVHQSSFSKIDCQFSDGNSMMVLSLRITERIVPVAFYDFELVEKSSLYPQLNVCFTCCNSPRNFIQ